MFEILIRVVCLVQTGYILEVSLLGCNLLCISLYVINRIEIVIGHFGDCERYHLAMVRNEASRSKPEKLGLIQGARSIGERRPTRTFIQIG